MGVSFFAVWVGACCIFWCLGGGHATAQTAAKNKTRLRPNSKKNTPPAPPLARTAKTKTHPPPLPHHSTPKLDFQQKYESAPRKESCFFLLFGRGCVFHFCCLGGGGGGFAVWAGRVFHFLLFGRERFLFFAIWAVIFCRSGAGRVFSCCSGGDGSSLTYRPACLGFKGPKKNQKKKKAGSVRNVPL